MGDQLYLLAPGSVWTSDGTPAGTRPRWPLGAVREARELVLLPAGDVLGWLVGVPNGGAETWVRFDGESGAMTPVLRLADLPPTTGSLPRNPRAVNDHLVFAARGPAGDEPLWRAGLATPGAEVLATGVGTPFRAAVVSGGRLFLLAPSGGDGSPARFWVSDGTAAGSGYLTALPGSTYAPGGVLAHRGTALAWSGADLLVANLAAGRTDLVGSLGSSGSRSRVLLLRSLSTGAEIWATDGTSAGSSRVFQAPGLVFETSHTTPVVLGHHLLFVAREPSGEAELWASDGTSSGTGKLLDLWPGLGPSWPRELTVAGGRVYFRAFTPAEGEELWVTDGTAAGTSRLTDLAPGAASSRPSGFTRVGTELFFAGDDGLRGQELFALPADAVGEPAGGDPPPPGPWLTSPAVPGHRFQVRIAGGGGSLAGVAVPACLPETLCVAGAVPGRVEVMLRVVGPRPNGFLWPTMVKLTTSQVEVWVEQVSSHTVRYYLLEGARPGFDELNGLFDRMGFTP